MVVVTRATASSTVTWTTDHVPPTFTGSYANESLGCNPSASDISAALGTATATDGCSTATITSTDGTDNNYFVQCFTNKNIYCKRCLW